MMTVKRIVATLCAAVLLFAAGAGTAQQPPGPPGGKPGPGPGAQAKPPKDARGPAKARQEERRGAAEGRAEAAKERRDAAKALGSARRDLAKARKAGLDARRDAHQAHRAIAKDRLQARREFLKKKHVEWNQDRADRIKAHREKIQEKWGDLTKHDRVRAELRLHAWRLARLNAIKNFATEEGNTAVVERADKLVEKENARHERRMAVLKDNPDAPEETTPEEGDDTKEEADDTAAKPAEATPNTAAAPKAGE